MKQYCNKFNKDFKSDPYRKTLKEKNCVRTSPAVQWVRHLPSKAAAAVPSLGKLRSLMPLGGAKG